MNTERAQVGWGFWLWWVLASAVGLAVGFAAYFPLAVGFASELSVVLQTLISAFGGAVLGASIGIAQWLVLRRRSFKPSMWALASTAGGAVGGAVALAVGDVVGEARGFVIALVVGGAVIGASIGIAQWLVLRWQVSRAGWWVLASTLGLAMGFALGRVVGEVVYNAVLGAMGNDIARVVATATFGILLLAGYGAMTGGALIWLLRGFAPQEARSLQEDTA